MTLWDEDRLTLNAAARMIGVHVSTLHRWRQRGVRGKKLKTHLVGGRRYVLTRDLEAFVTDDKSKQQEHTIEQRVTDASKELDALGVRPVADDRDSHL